MPNEHIELVKKWLANPESVSKDELEDNSDSANAAFVAACAAYADAASLAARWVKEYEELTNAK